MSRTLCRATLLGWLVVGGCARQPGPSPAASPAGAPGTPSATEHQPAVTPERGLNGKVSWVNSNLRFVVLTFPVGQMPAVDRRLSIYRHDLKVGEVKVCGPRNQDSIVADIVAGEAAAGDSVREN